MADDRENGAQPQQGTSSAENGGGARKEQFNELSELSLEKRIAVADQIGVPAESVIDTDATGAMSGRDDAARGSGDKMEEESGIEETEQ